MFVGIVGQSVESFYFTDGGEPLAKGRREFLPLRFNRKSDLRAPEDERIAHREEKIAARFE